MPEKTENLTAIEAMRAYCEGKRIENYKGDIYWMADGRHWRQDVPEPYLNEPRFEGGAPWSIVEPPKPERKRLTAAEALLCEVVLVETPYGICGVDCGVVQRGYGWHRDEIAYLVAAEQLDWPIYEVEA